VSYTDDSHMDQGMRSVYDSKMLGKPIEMAMCDFPYPRRGLG
jgi:hypothetical protein